ncbi:hypothetical protein U0070_000317 [Myodes glareolus]|uniref:Uncharacterized protein n=1 Tax=Myodes glareolus TaxID=447135 RepID=A0AAW0HVZ0_MYOGA
MEQHVISACRSLFGETSVTFVDLRFRDSRRANLSVRKPFRPILLKGVVWVQSQGAFSALVKRYWLLRSSSKQDRTAKSRGSLF